MSLRLMHRAVEIMANSEYFEDVLFPTTLRLKPFKDPETLQLDFCEPKVENNEEQLKAIKHIVCGTSRPAPYLIYGPPGTGKTFTLVETIKQVCKNFPKSKILVCAPQNDAADLIAERLLDHVNPGSIIRFNAVSRSSESMCEAVRQVANYNVERNRVFYPAKDDLKRKQIIVSTLVTSGRLVSAEMTDHFTHIFIDEAGHASEPETVIPIGLLSQGGQLVLAGDPKQLGAIIRSDLAAAHGLGKSLLERLMEIKDGLYTRGQGENSVYDENFVSKLLQNFRSHPQILEVPNQRFYEFELIPRADKDQCQKFCGWKHLNVFAQYRWEDDKIGFPLIFRQVEGREEQERSSPSWFNRHEVLVVAEYVELLLRSSDPIIEARDIGIISPYIQQVRKIKRALREIDGLDRVANVQDIKVGSVEKFQGDERDVIIISTVRSQTGHLSKDKKFNLGFVSNSKRFNVAVTRAKSLLIVVGNPRVLCTDENWRRLVEHIMKGGGYIGEELDEDSLRIEEEDPIDMDALSLNDLNEGTDKKSTHLLHRDDEYARRE
ncbi:putative helicase mov-10-B.2 [Watersipora subatra]|uniref:putative helicase mov-10-B.2 n=1 Tax=Watersipora subatra TaxID=2589382 RepID=UPI00355BE935